jgi:pimeloyl-ACP methyl ester carboxylesterase
MVDRDLRQPGLQRRSVTAGLLGLPLLAGCARLPGVPRECNGPQEGIDWIVDAVHPVFVGTEAAVGSPRPMTIYFPTASRHNATLLRPCLQGWPVMLFLHGMPPRQGATPSPWASVWNQLPATVARCGYVVGVPAHNAQQFEGDPAGAVAAALADVEWLRSGWAGSPWVDRRPATTTLAGHSYGALIAALVASRHEVGALVSLSGPYTVNGVAKQALRQVRAPSFFMWGSDRFSSSQFDDLHQAGFWRTQLSQPRYAAVYEGEHFDYIPAAQTGTADRGPCAGVGGASADLAALFVAAHVASLTQVGIDLRKPQVTLTPAQQPFAQGHLQGLDQFSGPGCRMTLEWVVGAQTGGRQFGLP